MKDKSTRTPVNYCRSCNYRMDAASDATLEGSIPKVGDWSVCIRCGELSVFNDDLTVRAPTQRELIGIQRSSTWPAIERYRMAIRWVQQQIAEGKLPRFSKDRVNGEKPT